MLIKNENIQYCGGRSMEKKKKKRWSSASCNSSIEEGEEEEEVFVDLRWIHIKKKTITGQYSLFISQYRVAIIVGKFWDNNSQEFVATFCS